MNEILYKRLDVLSKYPAVTSPINYVADTWVDLFVTDPLDFNSKLVSFEIERTAGTTTTPDSPVHRVMVLRAGNSTPEVVYPKVDGEEATDITSQYLLYPVMEFHTGDVITVQIKCADDASGTATATLNYLELMEKR